MASLSCAALWEAGECRVVSGESPLRVWWPRSSEPPGASRIGPPPRCPPEPVFELQRAPSLRAAFADLLPGGAEDAAQTQELTAAVRSAMARRRLTGRSPRGAHAGGPWAGGGASYPPVSEVLTPPPSPPRALAEAPPQRLHQYQRSFAAARRCGAVQPAYEPGQPAYRPGAAAATSPRREAGSAAQLQLAAHSLWRAAAVQYA
eukprot:TRINITY_DN36190_c0_g1_i1.p2 TRINITY_DN36190_c0_g1~~TRINITY_DN36190_c0_g1_i1.p2  ORF type:complete len:228 (+),score=56.95 TRINITY_DN36190_c0_g1_i1:75-686(+)